MSPLGGDRLHRENGAGPPLQQIVFCRWLLVQYMVCIYIYTIVYWICVYLCMFIGDIYCVDMRLLDISIIIYQMNISCL